MHGRPVIASEAGLRVCVREGPLRDDNYAWRAPYDWGAFFFSFSFLLKYLNNEIWKFGNAYISKSGRSDVESLHFENYKVGNSEMFKL